MRYFCALLCGDYQLLKQNINEKERDAKMKKNFKKIVAAATTAALAFVGTVTFNPADAKADDNYYVIGNEDVIGGWNMENAKQMTASSDGTYSLSFDASASTTYLFKITPTTENWDSAIGTESGDNFAGLALSAGTAKITFDPSKEGDARVTMTGLVAPNPAETYSVVGVTSWDPAEGKVMTKNDDGTYTAVFDKLAANSYEFKIVQDGANYGWYKAFGTGDDGKANYTNTDGVEWDGNEKLTITFNPETEEVTSKAEQLAAEEEEEEEEEEESDPDATTVTVHVSTEWLKANLYAFTTAEGKGLTGDWPGAALKANKDNEGYISLKVTLDTTEDITVIVNGTNATDKSSAQTVNIPLTVKDGANEFWITTLDTKSDEADEFGNTNFLAEVSDEAPEGWVSGEVEEAEVEEETGDDETGDDETGDDEEDAASAWDDAKLKIHVKMPELENWDALGIYVFGTGESFGWNGGSGELTGAWPGKALVLENDSETWYAFGGTFSDGFYDIIINNFVSDDEAAEGAIKCQIKELELTDGEYWITIDVDEEGKFVGTVLTEAPEDYDGTGLSDDQIAEDPTADDTDDATDDVADDDTTDDTTGANPASGSTDGLPVAGAMVVVMFSAAVVVASRKRRAA